MRRSRLMLRDEGGRIDLHPMLGDSASPRNSARIGTLSPSAMRSSAMNS
jgi:hypothetical protein